MARAAILIGVNRTGKLPELSDAVNGAREMESWALAQGMERRHVLLLTDAAAPLEVSSIRKAIRSFVDAGNIEQLILYFAGHGVNIRYGEYWLLSDAPEDGSAAINVEASAVLARRCGIPHVVFVSDACRSAAEGIQAQGISGSDIFPNDPVPGPEQAVDIFFATTLGRPALEVQDPREASASFKAIYTSAFLDAVSGKVAQAMVETTTAQGMVRVVRPRLVKASLGAEMAQHLLTLGFAPTVNQVPDARITSGDDAWLAKFAVAGAAHDDPATTARAAIPRQPRSEEERTGARIGNLLKETLENNAPDRVSRAPGINKGLGHGGRLSQNLPISPRGQCGIAVRGAAIAECLRADGGDFVMSGQRVQIVTPVAGTDAMITFADGSAALVPALPGYATLLTIADEELTDVELTPLKLGSFWDQSLEPDAMTRGLRSEIADAARNGRFRMEQGNATLLMDYLKANLKYDPALALYAAYAFHDLQLTAEIVRLRALLAGDIGCSFFDIDLLAGAPTSSKPADLAYRSSMPMMARGWGLLLASELRLPQALAGIEQDLRPSLWTHFNGVGASRLRAYLSTRRK